jgi:uncharacterized membrane protein YfcA
MKIRFLDFSKNRVNKEHQQLGLPPVEQTVTHAPAHPIIEMAVWFAALTLAAITLYLLSRLFLPNNWADGAQAIVDTVTSSAFLIAVAVGFFAQAVDGALGMAYGITATTFLLSTGASPAVASASVHIAEVFTTGFSGISHARFGNVDRKLFLRLLLPGMLGGVAGAVLVTQIDGDILKPFVSAYLLIMGVYILGKLRRQLHRRHDVPRHVGKLALFGGFVDAAGGGGWGPVVTTTLLGRGNDPRTTIGSVNFAEFFLALASAASFALLFGTNTWPTVGGLVVGGVLAAPFAALLCKKIPARALLAVVGILITLLSVYNLYRALA